MKNLGKFIRRIALCVVAACPMAVSCNDLAYDDTEIREQIDILINKVYELEQRMNDEIGALQAMLEGNLMISSVKTNTETGVTTITLSDGKTLELLPPKDLTSTIVYMESKGVKYWAYIDTDGTKKYILDKDGQAIPIVAEMPEVITRDGQNYLVIGGKEYSLAGNSIFSNYKPLVDEAGNVYAVTFTFGDDMSFTITVDGAASFMFVINNPMTGPVAVTEQFVPFGTTAKVQYLAVGVVDYLLQVPDGWRVEPYKDEFMGDGFDITAPSAELVEKGIAAAKGELKAIAVLQGGKAMVARIDLTTEAFKEFYVADGKANVKMNNGLSKYAYGVCEASAFDEDVIYAKAVENLDVYNYPAGYGMSFDNLVNEPLKTIAQAELVPGNQYVFWALPALYDDVKSEYYLNKGTFVKTAFTYSTVTMGIVNQSTKDVKINLEVLGAEAYYFGVVSKELYNVEDVIYRLNINDGLYTPKTEMIYTGSAFEHAGVTSEPSTEYVAWVVVSEAGKKYVAADVKTMELATQDLQPGSAVKVNAELKEAVFDVTAHITAPGAEMIYFSFLTAAEAKNYTDAAGRAKYLFDNGRYVPAAGGVDVKASEFITKMKPETAMVLMALATDSEGKYSEVLYKECATTPLQYNAIKVGVEVALNSPEEVKLNVSATGGEVVEYLYWIGKTSNNTWKSSNYLGGKAETAQEYMYLNAGASMFAEMARNYPVTDGVISITDHTPGVQYVIVIMAKDKNDVYSKATELKFTPNSKNIGKVVLESDPKWAEAKPELIWIEQLFMPAIGMMQGSYALDLKLKKGFTAYVLCGTDYYFTNGAEPEVFGPIPVEEKILTVMEWTDKPRDLEKVVDEAAYQKEGYPYGHEFYHYEHGAPSFGNAVIWASKEAHDAVCNCVEKDVEKTTYDGKKYIQHHLLTFNDGTVWRFEQHQAIGSKEKVVDRVFVVLQDMDGNCYQTYEWDVPVEYFIK